MFEWGRWIKMNEIAMYINTTIKHKDDEAAYGGKMGLYCLDTIT